MGAAITVDDQGMMQGATAKYWERTKVYPNKYWADFTADPGRQEGGDADGRRGRDPVASGKR